MSIALVCDKCGDARRLEAGQLHPVILPAGWTAMTMTQSAGGSGHGGTITQHTCASCSPKGTPIGERTIIDPKRLRG